MEGIQWGEGLQRVGLHSSAGAAGEGDRIRELYTTNEEDLLHVHVKKLICNIHQDQVTDVQPAQYANTVCGTSTYLSHRHKLSL